MTRGFRARVIIILKKQRQQSYDFISLISNRYCLYVYFTIMKLQGLVLLLFMYGSSPVLGTILQSRHEHRRRRRLVTSDRNNDVVDVGVNVLQKIRDDITGVSPLDKKELLRLQQQQVEARGDVASLSLSSSSSAVTRAPTHSLLMQAQAQSHGWMQTMQEQITKSKLSSRTLRTEEEEEYPRVLQEDCDPDDFLCNYCADLEESLKENSDIPIDVVLECEGNFFGDFNITISSEYCMYFSQGEPGVYNASLYNPETDICFVITAESVTVNGTATVTESYGLSREGAPEASFVISRTEFPCNASDPESEICIECNGATLDGQECDFCNSCTGDEFFFSEFEYSCENIDPGLSSTCDSLEDFTPTYFLPRYDAFCVWDEIVAGDCSLQDLCNTVDVVGALSGTDIEIRCVSTGSVDGTWTLRFMYPEECVYASMFGEFDVYDADLFNATTDFCYMESEGLTGDGFEVTSETFFVEFTRPERGTYEENYETIPCDGDDDGYGYDFGILPTGVCSDDCPTFSAVNGMECTSGCLVCDPDPIFNETEVVTTCTNVDASLVQSCDVSEIDSLAVIAAYVTENPLTDTPTMSPGTETPTISPVAGTVETEAPAGSPVVDSGTMTPRFTALGVVLAASIASIVFAM